VDLKILIVDDDVSLQQMLDMTFGLDERVAAVKTTGTPEEAVQIATDFHPDVVVVDSVLEQNGAEVGAHLRSIVPKARLISFSGMEREAPWADARVLKSSDGVEQLKREIFGAGEESGPFETTPSEYEVMRRFIHDIRNPIGAIIGFTHILKTGEEKLSEEQHAQVIEALDRTAARLSTMVEAFAAQHRDQSE
jgi:CheY-like chemotaxis protein